MSGVKDLVPQAVDRLADDLEKLSRQIHDNPELAYQEVKAAAWLADFLDKQGFRVERGVAGVATAFRATIETGEGPTVAILCEYDALPGIGHACGHNVIATAGVGAGPPRTSSRRSPRPPSTCARPRSTTCGPCRSASSRAPRARRGRRAPRSR